MASDPTSAPALPPNAPAGASIPPLLEGVSYPGYPSYSSYPPYPYPPDTGYAPAPAPAPYAFPPYPWMFAPPAPRLGTWALVSMICGVVSIVSVQWILAILAIVFGFIGLNEVKKSAGTVEGRGFAIAGIVTGFISVGITLLIVAFYVLYIIFFLSLLQTIPD